MTTVDDQPIEPGTRWTRPVILLGVLAVMWAIQIVDEVALSDRFEGDGIHPRHLDGLLGIIWAPFLHAGFGHLIANTLPFLVLGGLVMVHGRRQWVEVTAAVILLGGALTWLFGRTGNHIGASGLIFGYLGYLIGTAFLRRNPTAIITALVAVVIYGGLILGVVPRTGVSWEGHVFGLIAGLAFARLRAPRPPSVQPAA